MQNSEKHLYKKLIVADLNTNGYIIVHAPTENLPDILGFIYKANECVMKRITVMPEEDTYKVEVQMSGHTVPFAKFKDEDGRLVAMQWACGHACGHDDHKLNHQKMEGTIVNTFWLIIAIIGIAFCILSAYSCCAVAARADEE